ncbi:hypothetical protein EXIGLDRAFT_838591 [Exidia glandulosa HHB12029]|uniref:Uncharacterized protein n=1 Tax=Exidia glandulosa HHB12029 TaxID=1314781 RepID=A0A166A7T0_EXIGL|nr:hypothetical protein EXIGLDRAFT_838591 [Exidia glandulosa HHB12029]
MITSHRLIPHHTLDGRSPDDDTRAGNALVLHSSPEKLNGDSRPTHNGVNDDSAYALSEVDVNDERVLATDGSQAWACLRRVQLQAAPASFAKEMLMCQARVVVPFVDGTNVDGDVNRDETGAPHCVVVHFAPSEGEPQDEAVGHEEFVVFAQATKGSNNALVFDFNDTLFQPSARGDIHYTVFSIDAAKRNRPVVAECRGSPFPPLRD